MFYWERFNLDSTEVEKIQKLYKQSLPFNNYFFQPVDVGLTHFLGMKVRRFILIQVPPKTVGNIHTDHVPLEPGEILTGGKIALQIPLENCNDSTTFIWESDERPPIYHTNNGQPYNFFDPKLCRLITKFNLTSPTFFRTDLPHSVNNPTYRTRKAISIRFEEDPWHLISVPPDQRF